MEFVHSFGTNVKGKRNVTFYNDTTVAFIAGKLCVLYDLESLSQRLIHIIEGNEISAITKCFNHLALAIKGKLASICLFNLESETKRFYYGPNSMESDSFNCISISQSLKFVAGSGSGPDWLIVLWLAQTRHIIATFNPTASKPDTFISDVSFHAGGREEVAVAGKQILRLYEYQNEGDTEEIKFSEVIFGKFENEEYTSIAWTQKENLAVGTESGKILFFRGIEMVKEIVVADSADSDWQALSTSSNSVTCLAVSASELFCVFGGRVVVTFRGEEISQYKFCRMFFLPKNEDISALPGIFPLEHGGTINHLEISSNNQTVIISTDIGELAYLSCSDDTDENYSYFKLLLPAQHTSPVIALSCARGRSLIATCSKHVFILWNYITKTQEMYLMFKDEITSMTLHPTGLYVVIGFKFHTRICTIMCNGLKDKKTIKVKNCSKISFSNGGQYLALANDFCISVFSFATFSILTEIKGHAGLVTGIIWKENDIKMVSCDNRGVICEWNAVTWNKIWANTAILSYSSVTVTPNNNFIISTCKEKVIKCLHEGLVIWESSCHKELTAIVSDCEGEELYCGTADGNIGKLHNSKPKSVSDEIHAHNGKTVDIKLSFDCTHLFSVGDDGLLMCWKCTSGNTNPMKYMFSEVNFQSNSDIEEQTKRFKMLQMAIQENEIGYECERKLNQLKYQEKMKKMFLQHELIVKELNQAIFNLSEKKQSLLFDVDYAQSLRNIENELRAKTLNYAVELDTIFKKTDECAIEIQEKVSKYDDVVKKLEESYANIWLEDTEREESILTEITEAENALLEEKRVTQQKKQDFEDDKKKLEVNAIAEVDSAQAAQESALAKEKNEVEQVKREIRKLTNKLIFVQEDNQQKLEELSGRIEFDVQEKVKCLHVLEKELKIIEDKLKLKERMLQSVEATFFRSKKDVEEQSRFHSVSKSAVEQIKLSIGTAELEIQSQKKRAKDITDSFETLESALKTSEDHCSVINDQLKDSVQGFYHKRALIRTNQNILSKYKYLLRESLSPTCDAEKLKQDILLVLDQYRSRTADSLDANLTAEFAHQISVLQTTYEGIKDQPVKAMKDLAIADFRLSQENSKLLKEVHVLQRDVGELGGLVFKMETAMGLPFSRKAKPTKDMNDLRDKIELVISASKKNESKCGEEVANLDKLIEEQKCELVRLKKLISVRKESKIDSE